MAKKGADEARLEGISQYECGGIPAYGLEKATYFTNVAVFRNDSEGQLYSLVVSHSLMAAMN